MHRKQKTWMVKAGSGTTSVFKAGHPRPPPEMVQTQLTVPGNTDTLEDCWQCHSRPIICDFLF